MTGAPTAALLGIALLLVGAGFDSPSLLVPGVGMLVLALVAVLWVELSRARLLVRAAGPARVVEDDPYPVRLTALGGRLPPPGGELTDPLLATPIAIGPRWPGAHAADVLLRGRGRRRLVPPGSRSATRSASGSGPWRAATRVSCSCCRGWSR